MSSTLWRRVSRPPWSFLALATALLLTPLGFMDSGASAQDRQTAPAGQGRGLDLFITNPDRTFFDFSGEFAIPAGFFDRGSARYEGRVPFKGVPIRTFRGRKTGGTDTVVERRGMPKLGPPFPSRGTAEIELAQLSLVSVRPLEVRAGNKTQLWDVRLQLSSRRPSRGTLTVVQQSERGGTFDSKFTVFPLLKFVRRGDKAERTMDVGTMKIGEDGTKRMTLQASDVPWTTKPPKAALVQSGTFYPGVQGDAIVSIFHSKGHDIELTPKKLANPVG